LSGQAGEVRQGDRDGAERCGLRADRDPDALAFEVVVDTLVQDDSAEDRKRQRNETRMCYSAIRLLNLHGGM